ncbi:MAG: hypothetical protein Q4B57_08925 [Eubacteriales bacterium]|nr:hypothetical protein [Eubacteriales bacterium]
MFCKYCGSKIRPEELVCPCCHREREIMQASIGLQSLLGKPQNNLQNLESVKATESHEPPRNPDSLRQDAAELEKRRSIRESRLPNSETLKLKKKVRNQAKLLRGFMAWSGILLIAVVVLFRWGHGKSEDIEVLMDEITQLRQATEGYEQRLAQRESELELLQQAKKEDEADQSALVETQKQDIQKLHQQIDTLNQQNETLQSEAEELRKALDEKESSVYEKTPETEQMTEPQMEENTDSGRKSKPENGIWKSKVGV